MLDAIDQQATNIVAALGNWALSDISDCYLPDTGPFARSEYPKHVQFIENTKDFTVCSAFGGNRVGKSMLLAYCGSRFLTGIYPDWWPGRRFDKPTKGWVCGQDSELVIASKQKYLIGDGTGGFIPRSSIKKVNWSAHIKGLADSVEVIHQPTGYTSLLVFKTYREGWQAFQSDTIDWGDLDEEPAAKIYSEVVTRTATTNGLVMIGFTALQGVTPLVAHLLPQFAGKDENDIERVADKRSHVFIGWNDIPYSQLSKERRDQLKQHYLPHEIKARTEGIPTIGQGLVYPVAEDEFVVEPFELPESWPRWAALDPGGTPGGSGKTAALWFMHDPDADIVYAYTEYYSSFKPVHQHALEFKRRGSWIPFVMDPAGASVIDGRAVKTEYVKAMHEINERWSITSADKNFAVGRLDLFTRMSTGGFKVFSTCRDFLSEFRQYIINDRGQFVGACHLLDCARYGVRAVGKAKLKKQYDYETHRQMPVVRETSFGFFG